MIPIGLATKRRQSWRASFSFHSLLSKTLSKNSQPMNRYTTFVSRTTASARFAWEGTGKKQPAKIFATPSLATGSERAAAYVIAVSGNTGQDKVMLSQRFHFKEHSSVFSPWRGAIRLIYSPQWVCDTGQHPAGPGCDRNGTCWRFQISGEANAQRFCDKGRD